MTLQQFSNGFDLYYNNVTSNQAPGLNEWEKSMFLTKAEKEVTLDHFTANSKGNIIGQGFDDSAKRQADFSVLMKTGKCKKQLITVVNCYNQGSDENPEDDTKEVYPESLILTDREGENVSWDSIPYDVSLKVDLDQEENKLFVFGTGEYASIDYFIEGFPYALGTLEKAKRDYKVDEYPRIDPRSGIYSFPEDTFIIINESLYTGDKRILQVLPLRYDTYTQYMSKPFKRPLKNQAWRLMNSGEMTHSDSMAKKYAEIIVNTWDELKIASYNVRYVRVPKPIILAPMDGLDIDGYLGKDEAGNFVYADSENPSSAINGIGCELDPILHEEILQRAVELAKIAWTATGQDNAQLVLQSGQRSE